jgi:ABC-2 type transport system ATP-binding protein
MLELKELSKRFGKHTALDGVTVSFPPGITALIGPNGAGKTTLIKIACGVLLPDTGEVFYDGLPLSRFRRSLIRKIGVVLENAENVYGYLTVWANLRFFATLWDLPEAALQTAQELLEQFDLAHRKGNPVNDLSRGNKQKVAVILALIKRPRYLFLDEPTLGLDVFASQQVEQRIRAWVKQSPCTVVLTTHRMDLAWRLADRFVFIRGGRILWEGPREALRRLPHWQSVYRVVYRKDRRILQQDVEARNLSTLLSSLHREGTTILEVHRKEPDLEDMVRALLSGEVTP